MHFKGSRNKIMFQHLKGFNGRSHAYMEKQTNMVHSFNTSKDLTAVPTVYRSEQNSPCDWFQHLKGFNGRSHRSGVRIPLKVYSFNTSKDLTAVPTDPTFHMSDALISFNTSKDLTAVPTMAPLQALASTQMFQHLKGFNGRSHGL